jgi:hypothetical protein
MHVDLQTALSRDFAERSDGCHSFRHGALEMGDAADDVDAPIKRSLQIRNGSRGAVVAVLGKGDELKIEVGRDAPLDLQQGIDGEKAIIAHVHMGPNGQQSLGHSEVAVAQRPLDDRLRREKRLEFAPERDALQERAGLVETRQAKGERRVHMEVNVDEGRGDEIARRIDDPARLRRNPAFYRGDAALADPDIEARLAVRQGRISHEKIEGHRRDPAQRCPLK